MTRYLTLLIGSLALLLLNASGELGEETRKAMYDAKHVGLACRTYAIENGGDFPPTLDALFPDYITLKTESLIYKKTGNEKVNRWTYLGKALTELSTGDKIVLRSKDLFEGKHIIVRVEGSVSREAPPSRGQN